MATLIRIGLGPTPMDVFLCHLMRLSVLSEIYFFDICLTHLYFGRYLSSPFLLRSGEHQPGFYLHRRGLPPLYTNNRTTSAHHIASGFAPPWLGKVIEGSAAHHTASGFATPSCNKSPWDLQKGAQKDFFIF